jgi:hypothetical protein
MELDPVLLSRVQFAIGGGVITYTANGAQKVAVAADFTMPAWPTKIVKVVVLGLDSASTKQGGD